MLVPFFFEGKAGLKFPTGETALPARYDATWRISPRLYGFRRGEHYGIVSHMGRQVCDCVLPALYVGFREITPAEVLDRVATYGLGNCPPLQQVLGHLCYAELLRAEDVTPQLWQAGRLQHVLPSGELVRITLGQRADIMPAEPYATVIQTEVQQVLVLTENGQVLSLARQECAENAVVLHWPETPPTLAAGLNPVQEERWLVHRHLWVLLTQAGIVPVVCSIDPEAVFDWLPYDVLRLPNATLRRCRDHIQGQLNECDPQVEALTWQLIYLAWLAANEHVTGYPDSEVWEVAEQFVFDAGPFENRPIGELLNDYALWNLAPWLRDEGRFL